MNARNCASVLAVLFAFCGTVDARPPDYTIQYNLHQTAGHPTSSVDFMLTIGLMKTVENGNDIGWDLISLTIREVDVLGNVLHTWYETNPFVDSPDGLWWIQHADPAAPVNSEFLLPPRIAGFAPSMNPTEPALGFDFEGVVYVAPPGGAPFADTASLTTFLQEEGDPKPAPKKDDPDEPVETPNDPAEPFPF